MQDEDPRPRERGIWTALLTAAALAALACSSGSGGDDPGADAGGTPQGASTAALVSAVDGADPWGVLGERTGRHAVHVERLASDCSFGPDVPFDPNGRPHTIDIISDPNVEDPFASFGQDYTTTLVQRGEELVFELGEGLVFARVDADRLVDVVRVGAEGATHYHDGFAIMPTASGFAISGESDWTFYDDYWQPGEACDGRTAWTLDPIDPRPDGDDRDLHLVLRWPASSDVDRDLTVTAADRSGGASDQTAFLGEVQRSCYVLHSTGTAGAADDSIPVDWVHPLSETSLPHHEEVVRCARADYGTWYVGVVNWSAEESVDFGIEIFSGPTLGIDPSRERWRALFQGTASPHSLTSRIFNYQPRDADHGAGLVVITIPPREPAVRPDDPISHSVLGFNKAAALDVPYEELLENVGLVDGG